MKYFAIEHEYATEVHNYLISLDSSHHFRPIVKTQQASIFHNTLNDIDFLALRLKYNIIMPTLAQLKLVESIYKINLNLDELQA